MTSTTGSRVRRSSLRRRITATIGLIVLAAVLGLAVAVHLLVLTGQIAETRRVVDDQVRGAATIYEQTGFLALDTRLGDPDLPAPLRSALTGPGARASYVSPGSIASPGGVRDVWSAQLTSRGSSGSQIISLHVRLDPGQGVVGAVDRSLLLAGAGTVLAAAIVGAISAGRLSRRLRLAARTAQDTAAGRRQVPLRQAVGPGRDEVGDLADAVDAMATQLDDRLRSEQRFTADVAHDLRTPLTGLVTAAALLDDSRPAQLVRERAEALTALTEELLEVARLDAGTETAELEQTDLGEFATRALERAVARQEFPAAAVTVDVEQPAVVLTDPRRLDRVLSNLLRNAVRHGAPPVTLKVKGARISVTDHGPGFPAALLSGGPERFRSGSNHRGSGHGLGLVIAAGQARVLGSVLHLANVAGGGAQAVLELPSATGGVGTTAQETTMLDPMSGLSVK